MRILFIFLFSVFTFFCKNSNVYAGKVKVSKLSGQIDWNSAENYAEAMKTMEIAREIDREKRRKKQLRDAGMSEDEIKKIIKNERMAREKGNINVDAKSDDNSKNAGNESILEDKKDKVIINDYDTYGKKSSNDTSNNEESLTIDLSAVPEPPVVNTNSEVKTYNSNYYDDFELDRMLQKVGENVNNSQNFAIFAKEVARIANKPVVKESISVPKMIKNVYNTNLEKNYELKRLSAEKNQNKHNKDNLNKPNIYVIAKKINSDKKNKIKNDYKKYYFYAINNDKNEELDVNDSNTMSLKQLEAKNIGAPYPFKRDNKSHLNQYQPQNISQVYYDKNNKHLKPIVFEKHVVNQVINNLGADNAVEIVRALINKFGKTDITDDDGNTILMHAVARKNKSLVSMLLSEGANPNFLNKEGFAPIHLAASNGDDFSVHSLIMSGANPNLVDKNGNTPLMYASKMCSINSIKMMIALGGDPLLKNKFNKKTAIDFAKENKNRSVISVLNKTNNKIYGKRKPIVLNNL